MLNLNIMGCIDLALQQTQDARDLGIDFPIVLY